MQEIAFLGLRKSNIFWGSMQFCLYFSGSYIPLNPQLSSMDHLHYRLNFGLDKNFITA
jgi:hypothetical protein